MGWIVHNGERVQGAGCDMECKTVTEQKGILWIVATPIGTLADLGRRAEEVLAAVDLLLAEDTRRTRRLLTGLGIEISGRLRSLHEHNESKVLPSVLEALHGGNDIAIVSDAGTPVLSDPGFLLVRRVREEGLKVASVPGPSAFTAALAASGQPPLPATLVGFLPPRSGTRRRKLEAFTNIPGSLVLFLSPHRLSGELTDVRDVMGRDRPATLLAELSKRYERAEFGTLDQLVAGKEAGSPRGEYVLVVGPVPDDAGTGEEPTADEAKSLYRDNVAALGDRREALRATARQLRMTRRSLYSLLLENDGS